MTTQLTLSEVARMVRVRKAHVLFAARWRGLEIPAVATGKAYTLADVETTREWFNDPANCRAVCGSRRVAVENMFSA